MTWFQDANHHILESKSSKHRLLYCPLCQKLISKTECQKLRQNNLYKIKTYRYDRISKVERAKRKEEVNEQAVFQEFHFYKLM
jgi:hypothetical protein